jgi:hypothetical protein
MFRRGFAGDVMIFATKNGKLDAGQDALVTALAADLAKPGARLLLHLHGGLVDDAAGRALAARLTGGPPDGFTLKPDWTQVYVVWRTGGFETLKTNWTELAQNDRLYAVVLKKLMWFVAGRLGVPGPTGRSAAAAVNLSEAEIALALSGQGPDRRAPLARLDTAVELGVPGGRGPTIPQEDDGALARQFQDFLVQDEEFNRAVGDIDAVVNEKATGRGPVPQGDRTRGKASYDRLSMSVKAPIEALKPTGQGARVGPVGVAAFLLKHAGLIAFRCFKRFRTHRDHGFHATLVEEVAREMYGDLLGATIWGMMVKDAGDHFVPGGFGLQLLDAIPDDKPVHIVVTAHSAGSIWAAQMLKAIKAKNKPITLDLVLLAPAARTDLFAEAIEASGDRVRRCRMFTMDDELERADAVLGHDKGYIYPSSLLYLVSGMFENHGSEAFVDAPLVGMQRFVGADWLGDATEAAANQRIAAFFQQPGHDIVYSPKAGVTTADSHGGFDSEALTLASVSQFLV